MREISKLYGKWWTKAVAMLLCIVSAIGIVGGAAGLIVCEEASQERLKSNLYAQLSTGYSTLAMEYYIENGMKDEVPANLKELNWEYSILKSKAQVSEEVDFADKANYLVGKPMADYEYLMRAGEDDSQLEFGNFKDGSLLEALTSGGGVWSNEEDQEVWLTARITDFIFSKEDGVIYAQTDHGYFPLDCFLLYRLQNANYEESADYGQEQDLYEVEFSFDDENAVHTATDMYRPDMKHLDEEYLASSSYIYFADEVLYWDKESLLQFCGVENLSQAKEYFGDSLWPIKMVDKVPHKEIKQFEEFENNSEHNRGWVYYDPLPKKQPNVYWVVAKYVDNGYHDLFAEADWWVRFIYSMQDAYGLILVFSVLIFGAGFVYLMAAAGWRIVYTTAVSNNGGEVERTSDQPDLGSKEYEHLALSVTFWHRMPWAIYTALIAILWGLVCAGMGVWATYGTWCVSEKAWLMTAVPIAGVLVGIAIIYCMNFAVRIKSKNFWKYTLIYGIARPVKTLGIKFLVGPVKTLGTKFLVIPAKKMFGWILTPIRYIATYYKREENLFRKTIVGLVIGFVGEIIVLVMLLQLFDSGLEECACLLFVIGYIVKAVVIMFIAMQLKQLQEAGKRVAAGQLDHPVDTSKMYWEFKKHGDNINRVGDGINAAVQERMKSEHFKTELITNVSHDIKTPLTSIINYVDLIKKQEITDPTMLEYVDVLDRQSARLKKLIEDLMEASKASTGNLTVNLETMDITVMLTQVVGEFEEKLSNKGLDLIVDSPQPPVQVRTDGRHLWRIFDNLMNNICKYAQSGTRVYINMQTQDQEVSIIFRNISAYQLNISSEELMERFVRGDSSRNTEGSGLGLSITRSLVELMGGKMELNVDGDLFKVVLKFPMV